MIGSNAVAIDIWRLPLDLAGEPLEGLERMLSNDERERAARFRFDRDRRRFIAARGFVRIVLGRYLGLDGGRLTMGYESHGKPQMTGSHAVDLRFNVAHSGEVGSLAVAQGVDVGVDVEVLRELPDCPSRSMASRSRSCRVSPLRYFAFARARRLQRNGICTMSRISQSMRPRQPCAHRARRSSLATSSQSLTCRRYRSL